MGMYPDHEDVIRILKTIPAPKPTAEEIYADVVLARTFLFEATGRCRNHGRHQFTPVSEIKTLTESFIGRTISDVAMTIAMRMCGLQIKTSNKVLLAKIPPLDRFEEVRDLWIQSRIAEQKQIDEEVKRWAEFRTNHPTLK
jgi:hypothetical protein